jgi:tRNA-specific 2-thiouridylase
MDIALSLGADYVATGHYSNITTNNTDVNNIKYELHSGLDETKDQSYFLCQLNQKHLNKIIFPIGNLKKTEVREIAKINNLVTADKKDSQGLCFVGKVSLPDFLQQKLKKKTGNVIEISSKSKLYTNDINLLDDHERILSLSKQINYSNLDGNIIGEHEGAHYFTIGQRKGLAIGGYNQPLFIIGTNTSTNEIFVGEGKNHPGLLKKALKVKFSEINWVNDRFNYLNSKNLQLKAKIRYRQKLQKISIHKYLDFLYVEFEEYQSAISPGQFVAIYDNTQLIASGVIC